jgi:hypothetical protein
MDSVKKYNQFIKEANEIPLDNNLNAIKANTLVYNKYKTKVSTMFSNAKAEDIGKISTDFDKFILSLPEAEKGGSDMLRTLFSSEKMKFNIKGLEQQKKDIDIEIQNRIKELQNITNKLKM